MYDFPEQRSGVMVQFAEGICDLAAVQVVTGDDHFVADTACAITSKKEM
jgi:hypothetical protein